MIDVRKNLKNNQPIGVFDSGVGGLSVLQALERTLPNEDFVFLADQLYVPYGEKTKDELINLVYKITDYFLNNHNIKMMVVACNTATCGAIEELREKYQLPIVGTVPAIKPAAENTKSGTVAIIATPSTSKSEALQKLIADYCQNINVLNIGCQSLEDTVEEGELDSEEVNRLLNKYLDRVQNSEADHLVLGCTHYPFLKNAIQKIVGPNVKLLNGNKAIAKHTQSLLLNHRIENNQKKEGKIRYFTTGNAQKFSKVASSLLKRRIQAKNVKL